MTKSGFNVSHLFDASLSTYCWLKSYVCRPCRAFWDHCLLTMLFYYSSVASLFSFALNKSSGVYLSSVFATAAWRGDVACFCKKSVWRSFICLSCSRVLSIKIPPPICRGRVSLTFAARGWWNLYLVINILVLVWRLSKLVNVNCTIPKLKVGTGVA